MATRTVTYNANAFLINGQPTPIISGAMHYFRIPPELWEDRILKAKQGGLNTIETYVAWNFHEYEKGKFNFTAERDLGKFLELCEAAGMFVILRPGPYICAEWNFGGFPAWLGQEQDVKFRTFNPTYLNYVDHWFEALFEEVRPHIWTRGGNIILVQAENEFSHISQEDSEAGQKYLYHLRNKMQALGVDVPIVTCDGGMPGCIQCINSHRPAEQVPEFRKIQPDAPLFSTEFWSAWYDVWGEEHHTREGRDLAFHTLKFVAAGAGGYNYYMYHGGTNFGYSTMYLQTTSYDFNAPISEAGGLTPKYFALKRVANFTQTFASILLNSTPQPTTEVKVSPELRTITRKSGTEQIVFIENSSTEEITAPIQINGQNVGEVTLEGQAILPVVQNFQLTEQIQINWSTLFIQQIFTGQDGRTYILLSGAAGSSGKIQLKQNEEIQTFEAHFETDNFFQTKTFKNATLIFAGENLANRNLYVNEKLMLLGTEVLRSSEFSNNSIKLQVDAAPNSNTIQLLGSAAKETQFSIPATAKPPIPPELSDWRWCVDTSAKLPTSSGWLTLKKPISMLTLGNYDGYGWYRTSFNSPRGGRARLHFTDIADRILVWFNGNRIGTSETPPEDRTGKFPAEFEVQLQKGENILVVLADNLGLAKGDWQIGRPQHLEAKGLLGPVHVSNLPEPLHDWQFLPQLALERENWSEEVFSAWEQLTDSSPDDPAYFTTSFEFQENEISKISPLRIDLTQMSKGLAWLNGRLLGRYWNIGPESRLYLPEPWLAAKNRLVIFDEEGLLPTVVKLVWDNKNSLQTVDFELKIEE